MATDTGKRWAVTAGAVGLVGGLALGATGLAGAVSPSPTPSGGSKAQVAPGTKQFPGRPPGRRLGRGGLVSAISADSLTLRTPAGSKTIGLNGSTTFYDGPTKVTRSAVAVGDVVRVLLADPKASSPVASVVTVVPAHLAGWVTSISGSTITLKDVDGFTRTLTTSSVTKVRKDGADATLAAITVGSFIHAAGTVDGDGTTLDALRIGVGLPSKADRVQGGKGRPGRFGGPRPGADPSADGGAPAPDGTPDDPDA